MSAQPDVLAERYQLVREIGKGGMADVFAAEDLSGDRSVAVKVMRIGEQADPVRFAAEMRILDRLAHPAIVALLDSGTTEDGRPYFVMQLIDGQSLSALMRQGGTVSAETVARVGARVAAALAHAHAAGVIHRDIKPANILIGDDEVAYLTDFGVARLADATLVTRAGTTIGTAAYLAPEQMRGSGVGPRADVYSLGLVLLEALTGRRAFGGTGVEAAMARMSRDPFVPADLPEPWVTTLIAMTRRAPEERPDAEDVAALLSGEEGAAFAVTDAERQARTTMASDDEPTQVVDAADLPGGDSGSWAPPDTTPPPAPPASAATGDDSSSVPTPAAPTVPDISGATPPTPPLGPVAAAVTPPAPPAVPVTASAAVVAGSTSSPTTSTAAAPASDDAATEDASRRPSPWRLNALRSRALLVGLAIGAVIALVLTNGGGGPRVPDELMDPVAGARPVDDATREILAVLDASARLQATDPALQRDLESLSGGVVTAVNDDRWLDALMVMDEMTAETVGAIDRLDINGEALDLLLGALTDLAVEIQIEGGGVDPSAAPEQ